MIEDYIKDSKRGKVDMGWLKSFHSFSFANYYDPDRMHFGALRVLNDDMVAGGKGFDTHSHKNMEIISIPLDGELKHVDSMGNEHILKPNDVQVMSAGSGIKHSEYNNHETNECKFLQIWVIPREQEVEPRYQQISFDPADRKNTLQCILSPTEAYESLWIHQEAYMHWAQLDKGTKIEHKVNEPSENGVYIFMLEGACKVAGKSLQKRDALAISDEATIAMEAESDCFVLCIEIPMRLPSL